MSKNRLDCLMLTSGAVSLNSELRFPAEESGAAHESCLQPTGMTTGFFDLGFEKKERDNITSQELEALRLLAADLLRISDRQVLEAIRHGTLVEVHDETEKT